MNALHRFVTFLLLACAPCLTKARAEDPLQAQSEDLFPLPLDGAVTLENGGGSFHIFGWYEPRVRLVALRKAYTAARLEQIRIEKKAEPAALAVRTIIPPAKGFFADRSGTVEYTVTVPETAHLKIKLGAGEITLQGLRGGRAEIELTNGRIIALNCYAQVRAHSVNGVAEAFYEWWENLPAKFDYVLQHGRIGARLPATAQFRVDAQTANGRIGNGFNFTPQTEGDGQSLEAATRKDAPLAFHFRTGGGNISIDSFR
ncbi:MAG: hypothetical protein H0X34_08105 [Chthoniobacterales bacterium]|nr:hypothetical protein [Chthoniobacterales bacterium]